MELYIFNRQLELQGIIDLYTSFRWVRRYSSPGEFELHCPLTRDNLTLLPKDAIVCKNDDDPEAGYVSYRGLSQDKEGKKVLVVKGKFLTGYLGRRIIWGTEIIKATTETAMRVLVSNNCITPQIAARKIDNLLLGDFGDYPETIDYQVSYKNLGDEVEGLATAAELGYRVRFDKELKQLKFEVYKGLDRSVNQTADPQAIFSQEYENVLEQEYIESIGDYRNFALIGGIGEGSERKTATIGTATGLDRFETFCDQANLSNEVEVITYNEQEVEVMAAGEAERIAAVRIAYDTKLAEYNQIQARMKEIETQRNILLQEYLDDFARISGGGAWVEERDRPRAQEYDAANLPLLYEYDDLYEQSGTVTQEYLALKKQLENGARYVKETTIVAVTGKRTLNDAEYVSMLTNKGNETLTVSREVMTFNGSINPNSNLEYRVDYDIGDIVTQVNNEWGVEMDTRITEIEEVYENKEMELSITFGNDVPTLIDKIKQLRKG